jgi:D-alanine transaminase
MLNQPIVYLNGSFVDKNKAFVSVMDRGFLFGDGVYEVFPSYNEHVFGLDLHLARLQKGLKSIQIQNPYSLSEWRSIIHKVIELNPGDNNQAVYLQITRGCDKDRKHTYGDIDPTIYIQSSSFSDRSKDQLAKGAEAVTQDDIRWSHCNTKATSLLPNIMYAQMAKNLGVEEVILCRNGVVTECSSSNVFIVKNERLYTHPKGSYILPGITREVVMNCASVCGIQTVEKEFSKNDLFEADEIWITSSTREVVPITLVDGFKIGLGVVGEAWRSIYERYQEIKVNQ